MGTKRRNEPVDGLAFSDAAIIDIVRDIAASAAPAQEKKRLFARKYPDFAEACPHLFDMALEPGFDMARLEFMLRLRDQVQRKDTTFEDASSAVGNDLVEAFVTPNLKPPPEP